MIGPSFGRFHFHPQPFVTCSALLWLWLFSSPAAAAAMLVPPSPASMLFTSSTVWPAKCPRNLHRPNHSFVRHGCMNAHELHVMIFLTPSISPSPFALAACMMRMPMHCTAKIVRSFLPACCLRVRLCLLQLAIAFHHCIACDAHQDRSV